VIPSREEAINDILYLSKGKERKEGERFPLIMQRTSRHLPAPKKRVGRAPGPRKEERRGCSATALEPVKGHRASAKKKKKRKDGAGRRLHIAFSVADTAREEKEGRLQPGDGKERGEGEGRISR